SSNCSGSTNRFVPHRVEFCRHQESAGGDESMTAEPCRFSVVVPTNDRPEWLAAAIESVLEQTFPNFDVWIVDDGSDARTSVLCDELSGDSRVHVLRNERPSGAAAAR